MSTRCISDVASEDTRILKQESGDTKATDELTPSVMLFCA